MRSCSLPLIMLVPLLFFLNAWTYDGQESDRENLTEEEDAEEESLPHDLDYYRYKWACLCGQAANSMIESIDNADTGLVLVIVLDRLKMYPHANKASRSCVQFIKNAKSARRVTSNLGKRHYHDGSVDAAERAIELSKSFEDAFLALKLCLKRGLKGLLEKGARKCHEFAADDPIKMERLHKYIQENKREPQEKEESESEESFDKYHYQADCRF